MCSLPAGVVVADPLVANDGRPAGEVFGNLGWRGRNLEKTWAYERRYRARAGRGVQAPRQLDAANLEVSLIQPGPPLKPTRHAPARNIRQHAEECDGRRRARNFGKKEERPILLQQIESLSLNPRYTTSKRCSTSFVAAVSTVPCSRCLRIGKRATQPGDHLDFSAAAFVHRRASHAFSASVQRCRLRAGCLRAQNFSPRGKPPEFSARPLRLHTPRP